jgi:hypothetical protein
MGVDRTSDRERVWACVYVRPLHAPSAPAPCAPAAWPCGRPSTVGRLSLTVDIYRRVAPSRVSPRRPGPRRARRARAQRSGESPMPSRVRARARGRASLGSRELRVWHFSHSRPPVVDGRALATFESVSARRCAARARGTDPANRARRRADRRRRTGPSYHGSALSHFA